MVELQVVPIGLSKAKTELLKSSKAFTNLRIPFERTIIYMHSSWATSFRSGQRGGNAWKTNAPATKIIKGSKSKRLQDTGALKRSLTGTSKGSVLKRGSLSLEMGTSLGYAEIQDKGKKIAVTEKMRRFMAAKYGIILGDSFEIPARPFMFFQKKDITAITKIFNTWLDEIVVGGGV